jgi:molybdopterin biosynthesis enzyme
MADTPEKRRAALEWQMHLEDLLVRSGGVTGGR